VIDLSIVNDEEMLALKKPIIDACVKFARKNGWSDATGILKSTLFLESEPMSLDELVEKTGYSKTTVRSNMNYLENLGMARRVVDPVGKRYRYKQHRYVLETDTEALKQAILSVEKDETHSVLQALNQIEKNLESHCEEAEKMSAILAKTRQFYEEMDKILELMSKYTSKELIELLEIKKN
jgi:HTH-type transcriptional regulator, glycine betaine synthesis regulator